MLTKEQEQIKETCLKCLPLEKAELGEEYYYDSLAFCLIDAIFSIGVRYKTVTCTVDKFCQLLGLVKCYSKPGETNKVPSDKYTITDYVNTVAPFSSTDYGAKDVFNNHQRTFSRKYAPLKAEAVYDAAKVLLEHGINTIKDIRAFKDIETLEKDFKSIKGQSSGISFAYFLMLSGDDNYMKIDRWLLRFVNEATKAHSTSVDKAFSDLMAVCNELKVNERFHTITPRLLDYEIWKYAKSNLK